MADTKFRMKLYSPSGNPATGLTYATADLYIATIGNNEAVTTVYTGANIEDIATLGTYVEPTAGKCRFKEVDATYHPGLYEIQLSSTRMTNNKYMHVTAGGASGLEQTDMLFTTAFAPSVQEIDTQLSSTHGAGKWAEQGSGSVTWTYLVTDALTHNPVDGVWVNVTTDMAGTNIIAQAVTNALGQVVFYSNPGTYYMWSYRSGYMFANPDTEIVPTP